MEETIIKTKHKQAYDTEENWKTNNPILLTGQLAYSSDKYGKYKIGNGVLHWDELEYCNDIKDISVKYAISKESTEPPQDICNVEILSYKDYSYSIRDIEAAEDLGVVSFYGLDGNNESFSTLTKTDLDDCSVKIGQYVWGGNTIDYSESTVGYYKCIKYLPYYLIATPLGDDYSLQDVTNSYESLVNIFAQEANHYNELEYFEYIGNSSISLPYPEEKSVWQNTIPEIYSDNYLWTRVKLEYVNNTDNTFYLISKPGSITAETENIQADWNVIDTNSKAYIKNKPTIPTKTSQLTNDSGFKTTDTTYEIVSKTADGLMSSVDKKNLDSIVEKEDDYLFYKKMIEKHPWLGNDFKRINFTFKVLNNTYYAVFSPAVTINKSYEIYLIGYNTVKAHFTITLPSDGGKPTTITYLDGTSLPSSFESTMSYIGEINFCGMLKFKSSILSVNDTSVYATVGNVANMLSSISSILNYEFYYKEI